MKACPYCAEQIQDAAIVCRYCQRDLPSAPQGASASAWPIDDEVRRLALAGQKIEAIKVLRARTGLGLKEAKDVVESVERGAPLPPMQPRPREDGRPSSGPQAGTLVKWLIFAALAAGAAVAARMWLGT